jgi:hypothetical protein
MKFFKHKGHNGYEGRRTEGAKKSPSWDFVLFVVKKSLELPR